MMRRQFIYSAKAISNSKAAKEFDCAIYHNSGPGHGGLGPLVRACIPMDLCKGNSLCWKPSSASLASALISAWRFAR